MLPAEIVTFRIVSLDVFATLTYFCLGSSVVECMLARAHSGVTRIAIFSEQRLRIHQLPR